MQSDPLNPENSRMCDRPQTTVGVLWSPDSFLVHSEVLSKMSKMHAKSPTDSHSMNAKSSLELISGFRFYRIARPPFTFTLQWY